MNMMAIVSLVLVGVGTLLILLGAVMSASEWRRAQSGKFDVKPQSLGSTLASLTKLLEALKEYPASQRMIVFGIVVLIIGGIFGGVSGLVDGAVASGTETSAVQ